jgi:hypothetical protein
MSSLLGNKSDCHRQLNLKVAEVYLRKEPMTNDVQVRMPTQEELERLVFYVAVNRAFDPLDPEESDWQYAETKVARANITVFEGYELDPRWRFHLDELLMVVWDDHPEHAQTFVADTTGGINPVEPDTGYTPFF